VRARKRACMHAVLVLRLSTERSEAVEAGFAKVVGVKKNEILEEIECTLNKKEELPLFSPFGDGAAGKKIVEILIKEVFDTETYKR